MRRIDPNTLPRVEAEALLKPNDPRAVARAKDPANLARFKTKDGDWHDHDKWPFRLLVFMCRSAGCPVEGIPFKYQVAENVDGVIRAECGRCRTPHTDIREIPNGSEVEPGGAVDAGRRTSAGERRAAQAERSASIPAAEG
jgi:hypothetical protein